MQTIDLTVRNPSGIHLRPGGVFVRTAGRFKAAITVQDLNRGSAAINAKSVMAVLGSGMVQGHRIRITADGPDEADAIAALEAAVNEGLGEALPG